MSDFDDAPDASVGADDAMGAEFHDAGTVRIGSRDYAAGLIWNQVDDSKANLSKLAIKDAKEHGADLITVRKKSLQYGLGSLKHGHKSGMAVMADMLANAVNGSFIGVFHISDENYYLVAVQNSGILATKDKLLFSRHEALEEFSNVFLQRQDWDFAFAPDEFELPKTKQKSIAELIRKDSPDIKLRPASPKGALLKIAAILAAVCLLVVGYQQYTSWRERVDAEDIQIASEKATQAALAAKQAEKEARAKLKVEIPDYPWKGRVALETHLRACMKEINRAPSVPGWKPVSLVCSGEGRVTLMLSKDNGTINWIRPFVDSEGFKPSVRTIGQGGAITAAEVGWEMAGWSAMTRFTNDSVTVNLNDVKSYLTSHAEENFLTVRLADVPGNTVEVAGPGSEPVIVPVSRGLSLAFTIKQEPTDLLPFLSAVPVTVMDKASLDLTNWNWILEGTTYERIPLPADARPYVRKGLVPGLPASK